jgi:hypothetical protein
MRFGEITIKDSLCRPDEASSPPISPPEKWVRVPRALLYAEFQLQSSLAVDQLRKQKQSQWLTLGDDERLAIDEYISLADKGELKSLAEQLYTVGRQIALFGILRMATKHLYTGGSVPDQIVVKLTDMDIPKTRAKAGFYFGSNRQLLRDMGYDEHMGTFDAKGAIADLHSLKSVLVPRTLKCPNPIRGQYAGLIEPRSPLIQVETFPNLSEGGRRSTEIALWIHSALIRDAAKFYTPMPTDFIRMVAKAAHEAEFPRTQASDLLFIKWLYFQAVERKTHSGKVDVSTLADKMSMLDKAHGNHGGRIIEQFKRSLRIAIAGGWLLPESRIEDKKIYWVRTPEMFPRMGKQIEES